MQILAAVSLVGLFLIGIALGKAAVGSLRGLLPVLIVGLPLAVVLAVADRYT